MITLRLHRPSHNPALNPAGPPPIMITSYSIAAFEAKREPAGEKAATKSTETSYCVSLHSPYRHCSHSITCITQKLHHAELARKVQRADCNESAVIAED